MLLANAEEVERGQSKHKIITDRPSNSSFSCMISDNNF